MRWSLARMFYLVTAVAIGLWGLLTVLAWKSSLATAAAGYRVECFSCFARHWNDARF
jgi:hypothetical protein